MRTADATVRQARHDAGRLDPLIRVAAWRHHVFQRAYGVQDSLVDDRTYVTGHTTVGWAFPASAMPLRGSTL